MARVLIAEFNIPMAEFVARTLAEAGHETMATSSCVEGLALFQERRPDLVLVNFYLEEGDGLSFLDSLNKSSPGAPAVMTTGLGSESAARDAMSLGALDYVVKGADYFRDLPAMVDACLNRLERMRRKAAADLLSSRLAAQAELAGWLDHNFKNILSAAAGALALIDPGNPNQSDDKRREYIGDCFGSLKSAMKLLEDLGRVTRVGAAEDASSVTVARVVDDCWRSVTGRLRSGGGEDFAVSPLVLDSIAFINDTRGLPPLRLVARDLSTILEALLKNSLEAVASRPEPKIIVRASERESLLTVSVGDNGRGMDEKVLRHAFEPLFSTKGKVGVGLSLTTVLALVNRHQGEIKIDSSAGNGALVEFTWRLEPA
jgi:signal transduction histidine kinase